MGAFVDFIFPLLMLGVPGYFVLQPWALARLDGGWRRAAMAPLVLTVPAALFSLYALSQDSNLWPIFFFMIAPFGSLYLVFLLAWDYWLR